MTVWPPELPASLGCISKTVLNKFSELVVKNPTSAFGCKPYKYGDSGGKLSSIYVWNPAKSVFGGAGNPRKSENNHVIWVD